MRHVFGDPEIFQAVRAAKFKLVARLKESTYGNWVPIIANLRSYITLLSAL